MRVSHGDLYSNCVQNLNRSTTRLMELNQQASSQKKINKPSDDPVGTARVMGYRDAISAIEQYQENIDTAKGWLGLADETLMQSSTLITRAKELAEQAATGTMTASNREIVAGELRQIFDQMLNLSNTEYEGNSIFSGHKVNDNAYRTVLAADSLDTDGIPQASLGEVSGAAGHSMLVQFLSDGTVAANGAATADIEYRYSGDGGNTWSSAQTLAAGEDFIDMNGVRVEFSGSMNITGSGTDNSDISSGSWINVRPSAEYLGDDSDQSSIKVDSFLENPSLTASSAVASGYFEDDVMLRVDDSGATGFGADVEYSYSTDGGRTWNTGNTGGAGSAGETVFLIPGGKLVATAAPAGLVAGDQFFVRANRADLDVEISPNSRVQVNNVGKDIFGGIYNGHAVTFPEEGANLFETMGKLIGALETNSQSGVQEALDNLNAVQENNSARLADVGARENRLNIAESVMTSLELNNEARLSDVEDVDIAELMTELTNQQMIYEAVLRSSASIMKMSMVNYL